MQVLMALQIRFLGTVSVPLVMTALYKHAALAGHIAFTWYLTKDVKDAWEVSAPAWAQLGFHVIHWTMDMATLRR